MGCLKNLEILENENQVDDIETENTDVLKEALIINEQIRKSAINQLINLNSQLQNGQISEILSEAIKTLKNSISCKDVI